MKKQTTLFLAMTWVLVSTTGNYAEPKPRDNDVVGMATETHRKGTVSETMDAGRYTYVRVTSDSGEFWAAAPHLEVTVDDEVMVPLGMPMKDFQSPSMGRTFDLIYFVSGIQVLHKISSDTNDPNQDLPLPKDHPPIHPSDLEARSATIHSDVDNQAVNQDQSDPMTSKENDSDEVAQPAPTAGKQYTANRSYIDHTQLDRAKTPDEVEKEITWKKPAHWREQPASGMRLVTFHIPDGDTFVECTIVRLGGQAGSVKSNIERWLGQLDLSVDDDRLDTYVSTLSSFQTARGDQVTFMDLGDFRPDPKPSTPSMLAAVIPRADATVFVKMMGGMALLSTEKLHFVELCRSLQ